MLFETATLQTKFKFVALEDLRQVCLTCTGNVLMIRCLIWIVATNLFWSIRGLSMISVRTRLIILTLLLLHAMELLDTHVPRTKAKIWIYRYLFLDSKRTLWCLVRLIVAILLLILLEHHDTLRKLLINLCHLFVLMNPAGDRRPWLLVSIMEHHWARIAHTIAVIEKIARWVCIWKTSTGLLNRELSCC